MLEYDRIDISEEIDINKTNASKECDIGHYWYFKNIGFKYEPYLCNGCHDLIQKAMNLSISSNITFKVITIVIKSSYIVVSCIPCSVCSSITIYLTKFF